MNVLLDSCVPQRLRHSIDGHAVETARFAGLEGLSDSALLDAMEGRFDILVTCVRGVRWQQNMAGRLISVVIVKAPSNRLADLLPLVPLLLAELQVVQAGKVSEVPVA